MGGQAPARKFACLLAESADAMLVRKTGREASARAETAQHEAAALDHLVAAESAVPGREATVRRLDEATAQAAALTGSLVAAREDAPGRIAAAEARLARARTAVSGHEADLQRQAGLALPTPAASRS